MNILTANLLLSTLVFWIGARLYVLPRLPDLKPRSVLLPILLLHSLRHLGLMFLAPGAVYPGLPSEFAYPAAFGDLVAAVLALVAIPAVAMNWKSARVLVWIFNIEGTLDLIVPLRWRRCSAPAFHGTRVLDPRVLGSLAACDALHYVRHPAEVLEVRGSIGAGIGGTGAVMSLRDPKIAYRYLPVRARDREELLRLGNAAQRVETHRDQLSAASCRRFVQRVGHEHFRCSGRHIPSMRLASLTAEPTTVKSRRSLAPIFP